MRGVRGFRCSPHGLTINRECSPPGVLRKTPQLIHWCTALLFLYRIRLDSLRCCDVHCHHLLLSNRRSDGCPDRLAASVCPYIIPVLVCFFGEDHQAIDCPRSFTCRPLTSPAQIVVTTDKNPGCRKLL